MDVTTPAQMRKAIMKAVGDVRGRFVDETWNPVHKKIKDIHNVEGLEVKDSRSEYDWMNGQPIRKVWHLVVSNGVKSVAVTIIASGCGTALCPLGKYEITVMC